VRGHQGDRYRIGVRPGHFQARSGPQDGVPYADQVLAVGAAPGLIDHAAIGLVGQDAAPAARCVELLTPGRQSRDGRPSSLSGSLLITEWRYTRDGGALFPGACDDETSAVSGGAGPAGGVCGPV